MNYRAVLCAGSMLIPVVGWISESPGAGRPGEGRFDFDICHFGKADYPRHARNLVSNSFDRIAAAVYDNGSKDIEKQDSRCVGTYEIVSGAYRDHGVCTRKDADGDQLLMRYETRPDLSGSWVAAGGSGKYERMTAMGGYKPTGNVPGLVPNGFKSCNHYTGDYKLQ